MELVNRILFSIHTAVSVYEYLLLHLKLKNVRKVESNQIELN